jgi:hypothetical protein
LTTVRQRLIPPLVLLASKPGSTKAIFYQINAVSQVRLLKPLLHPLLRPAKGVSAVSAAEKGANDAAAASVDLVHLVLKANDVAAANVDLVHPVLKASAAREANVDLVHLVPKASVDLVHPVLKASAAREANVDLVHLVPKANVDLVHLVPKANVDLVHLVLKASVSHASNRHRQIRAARRQQTQPSPQLRQRPQLTTPVQRPLRASRGARSNVIATVTN